jgi:type III pantothenate kinase
MNPPRLIAVDIGNSTTKVGSFEAAPPAAGSLRQLASVYAFATGQAPAAELLAALPAEPCEWRIASVHREGTRVLAEWVGAHRQGDTLRVLEQRHLQIAIHVDFPVRVGLDRLAAAVAVNLLRESGRPAIVVCAGSAITVNLVAADGGFEGGAILPGFKMAAEALYGADLLPLTMLEPEADAPPVVGKDTEAAIRSGLFWGAVGGVREIVARMTAQCDRSPQVFVTGGDIRPLTEELGGEARFVPHLVLLGIAAAK